jgi:DNA-binding transcriptional regulator LsrR (DeoR family)
VVALKAQLTMNERIKAAYLHYVLGVEQQAIAAAFEVNSGRVNEACLAIKLAAEDGSVARQSKQQITKKRRAKKEMRDETQ